MASVVKLVHTRAAPDAVWDALRDIGALHTRVVPGFVTATAIVPGGRRVTFGNGVTLFEPIVTIDDHSRRLVWSAQGGATTHYNASAQVAAGEGGGSIVTWIADFLPDSAAAAIDGAMTAGAGVMAKTFDAI
jgi:hypothetical protein